MESGELQHVSASTVEEFQQAVVNPAVFCGGGSVAAVTGSSAASLVLLVLGLTARRRSNSHIRSELAASISRIEELRLNLLHGADEDMRALDSLMAAQKAARQSGSRTDYHDALHAAAEAPLGIARSCLEILQVIDRHIGAASRFTVSDLGAAASLAVGAIHAATMMAEVNLALLADEPDVDLRQLEELMATVQSLIEQGDRLGRSVDDRARRAIRHDSRADGE